MSYTVRNDLTFSGATSYPVCVADLWAMTLSIQTSTTSASRFTVNATNADGFQASLNTASASGASGHWSILTAITGGAGMYSIDPGPRWIQVTRPDFMVSSTSACTVTIAGLAC
jgi:hypothetical protein